MLCWFIIIIYSESINNTWSRIYTYFIIFFIISFKLGCSKGFNSFNKLNLYFFFHFFIYFCNVCKIKYIVSKFISPYLHVTRGKKIKSLKAEGKARPLTAINFKSIDKNICALFRWNQLQKHSYHRKRGASLFLTLLMD